MNDDLQTITRLQQENAALRAAVEGGPLAEFVRYVAPFVRAAIAEGLWAKGADSIEHHTRYTLSWLKRLHACSQPDCIVCDVSGGSAPSQGSATPTADSPPTGRTARGVDD